MVRLGEFCGSCQKTVVNNDPQKRPLGNCVDQAVAKKIFEVDRFVRLAPDADKSQLIPPCVRSRGTLFGTSDKTIKANARKACDILREWKISLEDHTQRYIHYNHPDLELFLQHHLKIHFRDFGVHRTPTTGHITHAQEVSEEEEIFSSNHEETEHPESATDHWEDDGLSGETVFIDASEEAECDSGAEELAHADIKADILEADRVYEQEKYNLRYVLELYKAMRSIPDSSMTFLLGLFKKYRPVVSRDYYDRLPSDGRSLCTPANSLLKDVPIRRVHCGLGVADGRPVTHTKSRKAEEKEEAEYFSDNEHDYISSSEEGGSSDDEIPEGDDYKAKIVKPPRTKKQAIKQSIVHFGDVVDFGIEKGIYLESAGNTNGKHHRAMLLRVNAAKPKLLSQDLLRVADAEQIYTSPAASSEGRSSMNHFALRMHVDGVEIAKNSVKSSATPLLAAVDRIDPFDETGATMDERVRVDEGICIPVHFGLPFVISLYHGTKKPDMYDFFRVFLEELEVLDPGISNEEAMEIAVSQGKPPSPRRIVVTIRTACCDTPMKSWLTGEVLIHLQINHLFFMVNCFDVNRNHI
jgi:hypothetical protein